MYTIQLSGYARTPRILAVLAGLCGTGAGSPTGASRQADSVVNVSQVLTIDRAFLTNAVSRIPASVQAAVDAGLKLVLDL